MTRWAVSELPKGWSTAELGAVADIIRGVTFPASQKSHEALEGYVACLRTSHVQEKLLWNDIYFIPKNYIKREDQIVRRGDILMSMANSSNLVGKTCINETDNEACFGAFLAAIRTSQVDNRYVHYYLRTTTAQSALRTGASQTVNIANISASELQKLEIPVPPLDEQARIAQALDDLLAQVDTLKARLDALPALIKRFRQSALATAVSGKLTEDWRILNPSLSPISSNDLKKALTETYRSLGKKYKEADLLPGELGFTLPNSWLETKIGKVFDVYVGATPSRENIDFWAGTIPWVSSSEVSFCRIKKTRELITEAGYNSASTTIHPVGTVMLAMIGQGRTRGQPAILDVEACHNQNTAAIRVNPNYCNSEYLYYYLYERYEETRRIGAGNNQQALNKKSVQSLPFPLPPLAEQNEIVRRVEQLFAFADQLEARLTDARARVDALTQSILAKAFRGELVPQDPADEPASVLLERIKAQRAAAPKPKRGRKSV